MAKHNQNLPYSCSIFAILLQFVECRFQTYIFVILLFIFFENMYCLLFELSLYVALIVIVHDICLQYTVYHFIQTTTMLRSLTS